MKKFAVKISYIGSQYCGWQIQKGSAASGGPSIQETIQEVLKKITQEDIKLIGSGRTDAGVHSLGQVAHFVLNREDWDLDKLYKGMNSLLPNDIQVLKIKEVPHDFHAQRSTIKKQYSYYFQQGPTHLPMLYPYTYWIRKKLNIEKMNLAARLLLGEHDFKAFRASGAAPGSTIKKIEKCEIIREPIQFPGFSKESPNLNSESFFLVRFLICGNGFLKQMVRSIAGTLLEIGEEKRPIEDMKIILDSQDRSLVGVTAPSRGLWQENIWYSIDI